MIFATVSYGALRRTKTQRRTASAAAGPPGLPCVWEVHSATVFPPRPPFSRGLAAADDRSRRPSRAWKARPSLFAGSLAGSLAGLLSGLILKVAGSPISLGHSWRSTLPRGAPCFEPSEPTPGWMIDRTDSMGTVLFPPSGPHAHIESMTLNRDRRELLARRASPTESERPSQKFANGPCRVSSVETPRRRPLPLCSLQPPWNLNSRWPN